jgi:hypothetical protein
MGGIRLGGSAFVPLCSPPFGAVDATGGSGDDNNIYRSCAGNPPGDASNITGDDSGSAFYGLRFDAVLSPNGRKILYVAVSEDTGYTEIFVVNAHGGTPTLLLADASNYYMTPMWGPDSDLFVCVHGSGGAFDGSIETSRVSDPGVVIDTLKTEDGTSSPFRPAYNYNGSRISYWWSEQIPSGNPDAQLRVMDADGTNDALLDSVRFYRFDGAQSSWANGSDKLIYEDGEAITSVYLINGDGTGKTQLNSSGDASGTNCRVAHIAWPPADDYVIIAARSGAYYPARCELDGSGATFLELTNGGVNVTGDRQCLVADGRIWFIEKASAPGKLGSVALDGTDYILNLDISLGSTMTEILGGWYGDTG